MYDYQKKVKQQTSEIAKLEKELSAYSQDDSEEARKKVQELKISLEEAEADLEETEFDRYISQQEELLSSLYDEYELVLNTRLDDLDALVNQQIEAVNANASTISTTLTTEALNVGTTLSTAMQDIWATDGAASKVLATYGSDLSKLTTINTTLSGIKEAVYKMANYSDKEATKDINSGGTNSSSGDNVGTGSLPSSGTPTVVKQVGDGVAAIGDKVKFVNGKYYYDSYGKMPNGSSGQGGYFYITNINKKGSHPYHISLGKKLGDRDRGWVKLSQLTGYATGKKNFADDETAWTQENGQEFIVRPSDGAILTPIAKGDSVLTSAASSNIWDMANSPAEFIKDNLNLGSANVPNNSNVQTKIVQNLDKVVFNMPNVKNYEEMLSAMQKDKNFERLVLSMTVDQIAGKSSLAKGKAIR